VCMFVNVKLYVVFVPKGYICMYLFVLLVCIYKRLVYSILCDLIYNIILNIISVYRF
jgi:hypothetical protein